MPTTRHQLYSNIGSYEVSTNYTFDNGWETMVFVSGPRRRALDGWTRHYNTAAQARLGHEDVIIALQRHHAKIMPRRDVRGFASRARARGGRSYWTVYYRASGVLRVAIVRAVSSAEAVEILRAREGALSEVSVVAGRNVYGYPQSRIVER